MTGLGRRFSEVADLYDDVRPDYPDGAYDAVAEVVGGWPGRRVLDLAAGTGIASRALASRGASVTALDPGEPMVRRLRQRSPGLGCVVAAAEALPFRARQFDVVTCATAWHWFEADRALDEVARVLVPGGVLALWWANSRHGDGVEWEDAQSAVIDRWELKRGSVPASEFGVRPSQAADHLRSRGIDVVVERELDWQRVVSRDVHVKTLATHSNRLALDPSGREEFLAEVRAALDPWPEVTERLFGPLVVARVPPVA